MDSARKNSMKIWMPMAAWAFAIFILSTVKPPGINLPKTYFSLDKIAHFTLYAFLDFLIIRSLRRGSLAVSLIYACFLSFLTATLYGILIEIYQPLVGRTRELGDAIANAAGAGTASLIYFAASLLRGQRSGKRNHKKTN